MNYITIEINDTVGLNQRERQMLQNTVLHFAAMSNALTVKKDIVINPLEEGNTNIGVTIVYPKPIDDEIGKELAESLSSRFSVYFQMSELDLEAQIQTN